MHPIQALNRDNINKRASVGLVIINGGVNTTLVSKARCNPNALFPNIGGKNGAIHGKVDEMDLVYTEKATHNHIHMHNRQDTGLNGSHHKVFCLSRLNGQGFKGKQTNEQFMQTIRVLGFCDRSNDSNSKGLYPIVAGGIKTGLNIGNWTYHVGDRVMWHAMSDDELKINKGNGKADSVGDVKLVLKPYTPDKNSITVRPMYRCLRRSENGDQGYTKSYTDTCDNIMDAVRKLAIPVVYAIIGKLPTYGRIINKKQFATEMFDAIKDKDNWKAIENAVFAAHAPIEKGVNHFIDDVSTSELHLAQAEALDKLLLYLATHLDTIVSRMVGTILSESKPQENYDILIQKYDV